MIMNRIVLIMSFAVLYCMTSCSTYYYSTLASNDHSGNYDVNKDFVIDNDTACIIYSFYGEDGPVSVTIQNNLEEPLFVDWRRSALIVNGKAFSFHNGSVSIEGVTESSSYGSSYRWDRQYSSSDGYSRGSFQGEMQMPKDIEFIPPHAQIETANLRLDELTDALNPYELADQRFVKSNGSITKLKARTFSERNSPLRFRTYLALFTGGENGVERHYSYYETSFYLSELVKAKNLPPSNFKAWNEQAGNFFYNCDYRGRRSGLIWGTVALGVAGITGIILLSTKTPSLDMPDF